MAQHDGGILVPRSSFIILEFLVRPHGIFIGGRLSAPLGLRTNAEELEAANEELQSSNEEYLSANEELRAGSGNLDSGISGVSA
jgi:hypothetical protein